MNRENLEDRLARLAALAEPARRRLYDFVVRHSEPVSREQAAVGVGVAHHVAKFHLDRLVAGGLLDVEYGRPPGRGGPGAGRPTKFYRRSARAVEVSVPERRYDLAGRLLAEAVTQAERSGRPVAETLSEAARTAGFDLGREARRRVGARAGRAAVVTAGRQALEEQGFEPRPDPAGLTLRNCPFNALATDYTELVCGMNLDFMRGLVAGLDAPNVTARLEPAPGLCCVRLSVGQRRAGGGRGS
ncbi:MAG: transcriptional regulator [Actinobacteria bacterium]|nr:transcriptional regulator [Actinomycetota bacterium]